MAKNNWNKMARWYDGMARDTGHDYHLKYAIPTVTNLLELKKGQTIIEVGCGQGALAPEIKKSGCGYYGLDSSENMIKNAITRHKGEGRFILGEADKISQLAELNFIKFDSAVFMLSVQDMDPLDKIIKETSKILTKNGKIVIFMLHPSFRIPRQSGWGEDPNRKITYRRVDRYMTQDTIPLDTKIKQGGKSVTSYFYHRPLEVYFKELSKNGFVVDHLDEIAEDEKANKEFPTFMAIRAVRA